MRVPSLILNNHFEKEHLQEIFIYPEIESIDTKLPVISWMRKVKANYDPDRDIFVPCQPTKRTEKTW